MPILLRSVPTGYSDGADLLYIVRSFAYKISRLTHLFKSETGQSLQRYLESCRMKRAAELLQRTTFSVKQIATDVGFNSPFYFSLRFKAWTKESPKAFREARLAYAPRSGDRDGQSPRSPRRGLSRRRARRG